MTVEVGWSVSEVTVVCDSPSLQLRNPQLVLAERSRGVRTLSGVHMMVRDGGTGT